MADGLHLDDAASFEDWHAPLRERVRRRCRRALDKAAACGLPERAAERLRTLLADVPLQERHHRALMQLHLAADCREAALAQYDSYRTLLADAL